MARMLNEAALNLIKSFEELRLVAYMPTPNDVPTIGYGHTKGVQMGDSCTEEQADQWLVDDTTDACAEVERDVTEEITDDEFGALVSLCFNIGRGNFRGSTLVKLLNAGQHKEAAQQFIRWDKQAGVELRGLARRRLAEEALFETQDA